MCKFKKYRILYLLSTALFFTIAVAAANEGNTSQFPSGSKMAQLAEAGTIRVGVQSQYPLIGMKSLTGYSGIDIKVAALIAAQLGISREHIQFVPVTTPTREAFLKTGKVDMVIAAYTMTPERDKIIDFAGPYLASPNAIVVQAGNPHDIESLADLADEENLKLCLPSGSSQLAYVKEHYPDLLDQLVQFDSSAKCAQAVINGQVPAQTTELVILASLAKQSEGKLEVVPNFSYSPGFYGIGVKETQDKTFCRWINKTLIKLYNNGSWTHAYKTTLGTVLPGSVPEPPTVSGSCPVDGQN